MKRIIVYLFMYLFTAVVAQAQCEMIDEIITFVREEVGRGNVEGALSALRTAQGFTDLSTCPGYSRLADEIRRIESQKQAFEASRAEQNLTVTVNGVSFTMVKVQGGTFTMGATPEQGSEVDEDEKPIHSITLSSFYIGQTEVTQALWEAVMWDNPSYFKGNKELPVEQVSWEDCQQFIARLNQLTGRRFRLPTEAEWEYAARGGRKSQGYKYAGGNDIDSVGWCWSNSDSQTHPVAQKKANELGIYDMAGNVGEWCQDWFGHYSQNPQTNPQGPSKGVYRMFRSGCWRVSADGCRVAYRHFFEHFWRYNYLGLRLALQE